MRVWQICSDFCSLKDFVVEKKPEESGLETSLKKTRSMQTCLEGQMIDVSASYFERVLYDVYMMYHSQRISTLKD